MKMFCVALAFSEGTDLTKIISKFKPESSFLMNGEIYMCLKKDVDVSSITEEGMRKEKSFKIPKEFISNVRLIVNPPPKIDKTPGGRLKIMVIVDDQKKPLLSVEVIKNKDQKSHIIVINPDTEFVMVNIVAFKRVNGKSKLVLMKEVHGENYAFEVDEETGEFFFRKYENHDSTLSTCVKDEVIETLLLN